MLRTVIAIIAGACVAAVLAQVAGAIAFVAMFGIPLGMQPREPSPGEYAVFLAVGGLAAMAGAYVTSRMARGRRAAATTILAVLLAAGTLWGFSRPQSNWPSWWGPALATMAAAGAAAGGRVKPPTGRRST